MTWDNDTFPTADTPSGVGWMIVSWKIVKNTCKNCKRDYNIETRQFDHLPDTTTRAQAIAKLEEYKTMHVNHHRSDHRKNHTLFLCKVEAQRRITDRHGDLIP